MKNRWWVVFGAILIQLSLGAIYAWSVFTKPLVEAGWTKTETQTVFSAGLAAFAVVMVLAGRLMPKIGPRKLAIAGGLVLGAGYILAGLFGGTSFWPVFIFVGLVGGAGIGLAYVVPIAVGMRWFPDKKGLVTGLAVAGFGFGAMLWVKLAGEWGNFLKPDVFGLSGTFMLYGVIFLVSVLIGGIWMTFPPEGFKPEGWTAPVAVAGKHVAGTVEFKSREMLGTSQYYMIMLTFAFGASAGLMSIGLMKLFPMQALTATGMSEVEASAIAGTAMAIFFSLANGIGRIAWGTISDKIGRKLSIALMMALQGVVVICFQWMAAVPVLLYLGATLIGFNFGGNFALFPYITADTFGTKSVGQNYGWVFLAYGVGGIFGPILGGKLGDLGNFPLAFTICGVSCLVAALLISAVRAPKKAAETAASCCACESHA
ncbi:MAG: MFS transporter [Deltaproteobacteria bacterium CG11_big_fil_rev_8_21_14_0_20_49_13]|nr:MAG: MFS transporter [Deltaproteobacteria bacterium CG11_big_fil_rev_8_21_14_0_20_49_13]